MIIMKDGGMVVGYLGIIKNQIVALVTAKGDKSGRETHWDAIILDFFANHIIIH